VATAPLGDDRHQKERVSNGLGAECNCAECQDKVNRLGRWVTSLVSGSREQIRREAEAAIGF
jgi:hypothetical protein